MFNLIFCLGHHVTFGTDQVITLFAPEPFMHNLMDLVVDINLSNSYEKLQLILEDKWKIKSLILTLMTIFRSRIHLRYIL